MENAAKQSFTLSDTRRAIEMSWGHMRHLIGRFHINWSKTNADKRSGSIHAWTGGSEYIGQFRSHARAVESGASVTKVGTIWFVWSALPVLEREKLERESR